MVIRRLELGELGLDDYGGGNELNEGLPHYQRVGRRSGFWMPGLGISDYFARILQDGIRNVPRCPVWGKGEMLVIPQTPEELEFGMKELEKGLKPCS